MLLDKQKFSVVLMKVDPELHQLLHEVFISFNFASNMEQASSKRSRDGFCED